MDTSVMDLPAPVATRLRRPGWRDPRLLAGIADPQAGTVSLSPRDAFVGWLPQEHERVSGETIAQYIARNEQEYGDLVAKD